MSVQSDTIVLNLPLPTLFNQHLNGEYHDACLTELPWNIRDSVSLYETMTASFNALTELPVELPLRLPHLSSLDLSHNQLRALPESFGLLFHLSEIHMQHNRLAALPESFLHLVKLEKVHSSPPSLLAQVIFINIFESVFLDK